MPANTDVYANDWSQLPHWGHTAWLLQHIKHGVRRTDLAGLRHCRRPQDALHYALPWAIAERNWPEGQEDGAAALAVALAWAHPRLNAGPMIEAWARHALDQKNRRHINHARFDRLIQAYDWDSFLAALVMGVRLLLKNDHMVNGENIIRLVYNRALSWSEPDVHRKFELAVATEFYPHMRPANF